MKKAAEVQNRFEKGRAWNSVKKEMLETVKEMIPKSENKQGTNG